MLNFLKRSTPNHFARMERLLRDMPWLWAIRSRWLDSSLVSIKQVDQEDFLDYWVSGGQLEPVGTCYVHLVTMLTESVETVTLEGHPRDMYDVLEHLEQKGRFLENVRHMVTVVGIEVRVWRPKSGVTFKDLFLHHPRSEAKHRDLGL